MIPAKRVSRSLYAATWPLRAAALALSRAGVPDTVEGRFEPVAARSSCCERLRGPARRRPRRRPGSRPTLFRRSRRARSARWGSATWRAKRMKKLADAFYGRAIAYRDALDAATSGARRRARLAMSLGPRGRRQRARALCARSHRRARQRWLEPCSRLARLSRSPRPCRRATPEDRRRALTPDPSVPFAPRRRRHVPRRARGAGRGDGEERAALARDFRLPAIRSSAGDFGSPHRQARPRRGDGDGGVGQICVVTPRSIRSESSEAVEVDFAEIRAACRPSRRPRCRGRPAGRDRQRRTIDLGALDGRVPGARARSLSAQARRRIRASTDRARRRTSPFAALGPEGRVKSRRR